MEFKLIGPGYLGRSSNINASRCVNLYPELASQDSKTVAALVGSPGSLLYVNTLLGTIRGMHFFNNLIYFVSGNKLYSADSGKSIFPIIDSVTGNQVSLATFTGPVVMCDNGMYSVAGGAADQLAFVDGLNIHVVNVVTGVFSSTAIPAKTISFIGGYFIADMGGAKFGISSLYDGSIWPALAFSTADAFSDNLMAIVNHHNEAWLLNEYSIEIWDADGSSNPLPFSRAAVMDFGTSAPYSLAQGSNSLFFLANKRNGGSGTMVGIGMATGYNVEIVSSQAINYMLSKFPIISDTIGFCYSDHGHEFYQLTSPSSDSTVVFDTTTRLIHERSYYQGSPYKIGRHIANCYTYAWGKHYIGSYLDGKIYEMSENYYDDDGIPLVSLRTCEPTSDKNSRKKFSVKKFELDAEMGTRYIGRSDICDFNYLNDFQLRDTIVDGTSIQNHIPSSGIIKNPWNLVTQNFYGIPSIVTLNNSWSGVWGEKGAYFSSYGASSIIELEKYLPRRYSARFYSGHWTHGPEDIAPVGFYLRADSNPSHWNNLVSQNLYIGILLGGPSLLVYRSGTPTTIYGGLSILSLPAAALPKPVYYSGIAQAYYCDLEVVDDGSAFFIKMNGVDVLKVIVPDLKTNTGFGIYGGDLGGWVCSCGNLKITSIPQKEIEPEMLLSWSSDGGHSWSNDHALSLGKLGEYKRRAIQRRIGLFRDWTPRFAISDPVKRVFTNAYVEIEEALH